MAKTNWTVNDIVKPEDMNQIGQEINRNAEDIAEMTSGFSEHLIETVQGDEVHGMRVMGGKFQYFDGTNWKTLDSAVLSVNGKTGTVVLTADDVGLGNVTNVAQATKTEFNTLNTQTTNHINQKAASTNVHGLRESTLALGSDSLAIGPKALALGYNALATYQSANAVGDDSLAKDAFSTALGSGAKANKIRATALGSSTQAEDSGTAIGSFASANDLAVALGYGANAKKFAVSIGQYAMTLAEASVAIGRQSIAENPNTGVLGGKNNDGPRVWQVPGNFSVSGTKNFEIPHPHPDKKATHVLRHGAVESPTPGDTLYRYTIEATGNGQTVEMQLPDYFEHLNVNIDVYVSPHMHFGQAFGWVDGDKLKVTCETAGTYKVLVIGTRNDDHQSVKDWYIKGVEREIGESWEGETYVFEVDEILEAREIKEEEVA